MFNKYILSSVLIACSIFSEINCANNVSAKLSPNTLIPRDELLAKPDRFFVQLSPDGKYVSYFARSGNDVELKIERADNGETIRSFKVRNCRNMYKYCWSYTNKHILLPQDNFGDENDHIICLDIETGSEKNITPFGKQSKSFVSRLSKNFPDEILVSNNDRDARWFDYYRINIRNGKCEKIFENDGFAGAIFDENFQLKALKKVSDNGDMILLNADSKVVVKIPQEETLGGCFYHTKKNSDFLYASYAFGKDKASLVSIDLKTKEMKTLFESNEADAGMGICNFESDNPQIPTVCDPITFEPQFIEVNYLKTKLFTLQNSVSENLKILKNKFGDNVFSIQGRSTDDKKWLIVISASDEPAKYYLFDTENKHIKFLFSNHPSLDKYHFQKMEPVVIKSRDGLDLVCYLTRAHGLEAGKNPKPLVAYIHGGPWSRDKLIFDPVVQLLANRGYSVLQINYRGSTGFGKKFLNAIDRNLEGVRNDIIDAITWAINQGIADKNKIAIMGASFGGYSALAGLAFTPDFFCCGVDAVGPSNFVTLISSFPKYWKPYMKVWYKTFGNPENEDDLAYLKNFSPLFRMNKIKKPLIVFQGENDPRVNKAESEYIVSALEKRKAPVTYILYSDEGHGFRREPSIKSYMAFTEKFLARFLGGWHEPIGKDELKGSNHEILEGKEILGVE